MRKRNNYLQRRETSWSFTITTVSLSRGDAEYYYNMIRYAKPSMIIEIGAGNTTLLAIQAIEQNKKEQSGYQCELIAVEPYEMPWLEQTGARILREVVEKTDRAIFKSLRRNDILFIDSSHMIRPQGDIVFEYLQLLPTRLLVCSFKSTTFLRRRIIRKYG